MVSTVERTGGETHGYSVGRDTLPAGCVSACGGLRELAGVACRADHVADEDDRVEVLSDDALAPVNRRTWSCWRVGPER